MPQFQSPGGNAGDAIQAFLIQRAMMQRQREQDEQHAQVQQQEIKQRQEEFKLRQEQEKRIGEQERTQQANLKNQQEFQKAAIIESRGIPGAATDEQTFDLLNRQGFAGAATKVPGVIQQGPMLGADENDIPQYGVLHTPDAYKMTGGSAYQAQRTAAEERAAMARDAAEARAAQAGEATASREEMAREAMRSREAIAQGAQAGAGETRDLRNQLLEQQVIAAKDKKAETETAASNKRNAIKQPAQEALALIDDIEKDPGFSSAVGARMPGLGLIAGSSAATTITKIDRLKGLLDIDLIAQMKAQSRTGATGFGAMSAPELKILEDAAARLSRNQSEASFKEELGRLKAKLQQVVQEPGGTNTADTGGRVYYDMDGNPVQR